MTGIWNCAFMQRGEYFMDKWLPEKDLQQNSYQMRRRILKKIRIKRCLSSDIALCPLYASRFIFAKCFRWKHQPLVKVESVMDIPLTVVKLKVHQKQKNRQQSNSGDWHWNEQFHAFGQFTGKSSYLLVNPSLMCSTRASSRVLGSRLEEEEVVPRGLVTTFDTTVWATWDWF